MGPAATGSPPDPTIAAKTTRPSKRKRSVLQNEEDERDVLPSFDCPLEEFTYYIMERDRMRLKRASGEKGCLTRNPVLRDFHFCNNRREDDRTSIVMRKVFEGRSRHHPQYLWNVIMHRLLSKAWVNTALGFVEDLDVAIQRLRQYDTASARRENGTWRTSAFISSTSFHDFISNMRANWKLSPSAGRKIFGTEDVPLKTSFEHACVIMSGFKGVGMFHTVQTALDLVMYGAGVAEPRQIDPGPGAVKALRLLSYDTYSDQAKRDSVAGLTKLLNRALKVHLAKLDTAEVLCGETEPMRLQDTEHALCEYQKYVAAAAHCRGRKKGRPAPRRYMPLNGDRTATLSAWPDDVAESDRSFGGSPTDTRRPVRACVSAGKTEQYESGDEAFITLDVRESASSSADSPPAARRSGKLSDSSPGARRCSSKFSADSPPAAHRPVRACVATMKVQQYLEIDSSDDHEAIISSHDTENASSYAVDSPPAARRPIRPSVSTVETQQLSSIDDDDESDDLIVTSYRPARRVTHVMNDGRESDGSSSAASPPATRDQSTLSTSSPLVHGRQSTSSADYPVGARRPVEVCVATSSNDDNDDKDDDELILTSFTPAPRVLGSTTANPLPGVRRQISSSADSPPAPRRPRPPSTASPPAARSRPARASVPTAKMQQYLSVHDNNDDTDDDALITSWQAEGYYRIDKILGERPSETFGTEYHVLWDGYPLEGATWEPRGNLEDTEALAVWEKTKQKEDTEALAVWEKTKQKEDTEALAVLEKTKQKEDTEALAVWEETKQKRENARKEKKKVRKAPLQGRQRAKERWMHRFKKMKKKIAKRESWLIL
ncbi:hypothetical protein HDU89_006070 [Geranomyces variabilis]|nr:hypothetical protein HDU89_006070 [Geranomyces variabilis]